MILDTSHLNVRGRAVCDLGGSSKLEIRMRCEYKHSSVHLIHEESETECTQEK